MSWDEARSDGPESSSAMPSSRAGLCAQRAKRIFIGPMPYTNREENKETQALDFVRQHGLRIFLQQGGRIEEWTEAKAREYKQRLAERILESAAWYAVSKGKKKRKGMMPATEWKGDTFEVGKVAGVSVNMLAVREPEESLHTTQGSGPGSVMSSTKSRSARAVHWEVPSRPTVSSAAQTFLGASVGVPESSGATQYFSAASAPILSANDSSEEARDGGPDVVESTSSRTPLFETPAASPGRPRSARTSSSPSKNKSAKSDRGVSQTAVNGLRSILSGPGIDKGKGKAVRYANATPSGSQSPAPPEEVLSRPPQAVEDSSAAAGAEAVSGGETSSKPGSEGKLKYGDVIMRDRMLVRVFQCGHESIRKPFDEKECRVTRGLDSKEWDEFLVIWRKHQIEIYKDYCTPYKERYLGHKHLAFLIPLSIRTRLSLFSAVDFSFCLICPPTPTKSKEGRSPSAIFHRSLRGLNVFVLKPKSRSRAVDWIWNIWIELGGKLPTSFEVNCPLVHSRVSVPIPDMENNWKMFTRNYVVDQCSNAMEDSFAWQTVMRLPVLSGRRLELCWRTDTKLDWVWLKDDVDGNKRDWEVLFGLALQSLGSPVQLEMHLAEHYPARIGLENGKHLDEPPSVEGYVHTTKRKTQVRVQYYLSTHDGYLCAVLVDKAIPPPTPTDLKNYARSEEEFREDEHIRLRTQIMNSRSFWDLRNVLVVRRASHIVAHMRDESVRPGGEEGEGLGPRFPDVHIPEERTEEPELRRSDSDIGDEGGDLGMAAAVDKAKLKMHRSFELVLKNGRILRFETHSTKVAVEWVTHLRALVEYWTTRYRDDTATEMDILKESLGSDRITVSRRYHKTGYKLALPPFDPDSASQYMDEFWHWCVLNECRQIVKSGRVFMKSKWRGQYRHVHLILVRGCLVQFKMPNNNTMHSHQIGRINLIDAYVCSGYYAALALPFEEYDPNAPALAKIFQDGLETKDATEDTFFMLWYRPHGNYTKGDFDKIPIQAMNSKHKMLICRARSKLERDAWCWALNCEIERLVRKTKSRERSAREQGMLV